MVKKKNTTNIIILILIVILIIIIIAILYFYKKEKFIVKNEAARQTLNFLENKGWIKEEKLKNYIEQPKLGLGTFAPVPPPPRTKKPKKPTTAPPVTVPPTTVRPVPPINPDIAPNYQCPGGVSWFR